ncbi:hypothetical protein H9Q73_014340 [Fusarium xylarioides]|nr:hypothetical protein H9Q73_014340 [Fusarium xylarioides]
MVRPRKDLNPYRLQITQWKEEDNLTENEILLLLRERYQITIGRTTLYRKLKDWESPLIKKHTQTSEHLRQRIKELFFMVLNDRFILLQLQSEGFIITRTGLERLRRELKLFRRQDEAQIAIAKQKLRDFFTQEAVRSTKLSTFGRTYLYTYIRQQQLVLSRHEIYETYREFYPGLIAERWNTVNYRRKGWTPPGPDFVWSLDAYDKLKPYGFEIYASIDAYSRMITWFYVGISASTSRNTLEQYLYVLSTRKTMPHFIRSDRGVETVLTAAAHYYLSRDRVQLRNGMQEAEYFSRITHNGHFADDSVPDRISMLYLFMPMIREELANFVQVWNQHYIRSQKNRPHVPAGQPWALYFQPEAREGIRNCSEVIPEQRLRNLQNIFAQDPIDINAYLPAATMSVCDSILTNWEEHPNDSESEPLLSTYLYLRDCLTQHIRDELEPQVSLLDKPTGALERVREHLVESDINITQLESLEAEAGEIEDFYDIC